MDIFELSHQDDTTIHISFIEIYNSGVYDLLAENIQQHQLSQKFMGGTKRPVRDLEEARGILCDGNRNRHVRKTKMNASSSRSHAIFTIHVMRGNTKSAMNLVDLAGSEGIRRTNHEGEALTEGRNINLDLLNIGNVLRALAVKSKVIPWRHSMLTKVLQGMLYIFYSETEIVDWAETFHIVTPEEYAFKDHNKQESISYENVLKTSKFQPDR